MSFHRQALYAIEYLSFHGMIHRDVKLENFICKFSAHSDEYPIIQLIDFGLSMRCTEVSTQVAGE